MTITKFSSLAPPSFVRTDLFTVGVFASWITIGINEIKLSDGDYLIQDDNGNLVNYVTASLYNSDAQTQQLIKETVSKQCLRTIWQTLTQSGLSDTVKASLLNTIIATIVALTAGEIKAALIIANATATTTDFTAGRKTTLINLLNNSISLL